jgi:hypothetical protein
VACSHIVFADFYLSTGVWLCSDFLKTSDSEQRSKKINKKPVVPCKL